MVKHQNYGKKLKNIIKNVKKIKVKFGASGTYFSFFSALRAKMSLINLYFFCPEPNVLFTFVTLTLKFCKNPFFNLSSIGWLEIKEKSIKSILKTAVVQKHKAQREQ